MKIHKELVPALGTAALPLGLHFASGRAGAFFYAQMAGASWLGILMSGCCFALALHLFARCSRREWGRGARCILAVLRLCLAAMLLRQSAHIGALVLPLHRAGAYAAAFAGLVCAAVVFSGRRRVMHLNAAYGVFLAVFLCLLRFAPDAKPAMHMAVELRLGGCIPAALLLGICHGALSACMAAGGFVSAGRSAVLAGFLYTLLLALGNAVFTGRNPALLRLKDPFAALASGWGTAGFWLCALIIFLGVIAALSGILYGSVSEQKCRNSGKNRC